MYIKTGDTVIVRSGKSKGQKGKVLEAYPMEGLVLVEGINKQTKHQRKKSQRDKAQIIEREAPVRVSQVSLIDPKSGKATRVRFEVKGDKKVRVAVKSGVAV